MDENIPPLWELNTTELLELIRVNSGARLRRCLPLERLVEIVETGAPAEPQEYADTTPSRRRLQLWIEKNWVGINSQLPCKGPHRGQCTIYPCSEGRHMDCYLNCEKHLL